MGACVWCEGWCEEASVLWGWCVVGRGWCVVRGVLVRCEGVVIL